ncbi:MAG: VCBS repeat-containing protein, partial [Planctomycetota bacterium]
WTPDIRRDDLTLTGGGSTSRAADFDGDGLMDFLVRGPDRTTFLLRSSGQGFDRPLEFDFEEDFGFVAELANVVDVNLDGWPDLLPIASGMGAKVFLGDGAFGFTSVDLVDPAAGATFVRAAFDADGDGRLDVLYQTSTGPRLSFGDGTLPYGAGVAAATSLLPSLDALDFFLDVDGDGADDFVGARSQSVVRYGPVSGAPSALGPAVPFGYLRSGAMAERGEPIDVDGDGDLDFVVLLDVTGGGSGFANVSGIALVENLGGSRFEATYDWGPAFQTVSVATTGDFDGDGGDELALFGEASADGSGVTYVYGFDGSGEPVERARLTTGGSFGAPTLEAFDVDLDGFDDVIVVPGLGTTVRVHRGGPSGVDPNPVVSALASSVFEDIQFADGDGDGRRDAYFVASDWTLRFAANLGGGTFGAGQPTSGVGGGERFVVDFDSDGQLDVLRVLGRDLFLHVGSSATTFGAEVFLFDDAADSVLRWLEFADIDLDGALDVVLHPTRLVFDDATGVFLGDGMGGIREGFAVPGSLRANAQPPALVDLDGDGDVDLLEVWSEGGQSDDNDRIQYAENLVVPRSGTVACEPTVENSTGRISRLDVYGAPVAAGAPLRLLASSLPRNVFGFFIGAPTSAPPVVIPGSVGSLCLGPNLGRYIGPGEIGVAGEAGAFELEVAPDDLRSGGSAVTATAGLSWTFQAWHRDVVGGASTSNLTSAVTVTYE